MIHGNQSRVLGRSSHSILIAIAAAAISFALADQSARGRLLNERSWRSQRR
jgi:hypothetical protein